jgi:predicted metal-dependent phosphoesterase TrpH
MLIDLHIHTNPKSPCSSMTLDQVVEEAKRIGLDGVCLMEHDILWPDEEITLARLKYKFLILKGYEISSFDGHFLAYGYKELVAPYLEIREIREILLPSEGFLAIAHPFREFLVAGIEEIGLKVEEEAKKALFQFVDGIEVLNGRVSKKANKFTKKVNSILNLKEIGGSDAHEIYEIGKIVTDFKSFDIKNETDLVRELKMGSYEVKYFRDEKK